jgi:hypothetical protein
LHNNFIRRVANLDGKTGITHLDLTHNWIAEWQNVDAIAASCPNVKELGLRCNPLATKKTYRAQVFRRLTNLVRLDTAQMSDNDREMMVTDELRPLTSEMIFNAVKDQRKSFFEVPTDDVSSTTDPKDTDPAATAMLKYGQLEQKPNWERQIEILSLAHSGISLIRNMEPFANLKKLNLLDNSIIQVEGLESCRLLEELSLEKNKITAIENIGHLKYLKKLDLGQNRITQIRNIRQLESLTQLSLEDNQIARLSGFEDM